MMGQRDSSRHGRVMFIVLKVLSVERLTQSKCFIVLGTLVNGIKIKEDITKDIRRNV